MNSNRAFALVLILAVLAARGAAAAGPDIESISPRQAYERLAAPGTHLGDVRSVAEYVLVGHVPGSWSVPLAFWSDETAGFVPNPDFLKDLKARFPAGDTLLFICRGGGRSLRAAQAAAEAGFPKVGNVAEGCAGRREGKDPGWVGGWRGAGLPVTYEIDSARAYKRAG